MAEHKHGSHLWMMVICCLIPLAAFAAISVFRVPVSNVLSWGLILLCPLSHLLMMGWMFRRHDGEAECKEHTQPQQATE